MKIVVWKSPRILRGLLRSIFGDSGITGAALSYHGSTTEK